MGIFGPSYKDDWKIFCAGRENAKFINGGLLKKARIEYSFRNWIMVVKVFWDEDSSWTEIKVPFVRKKTFDITLSRNTIFNKVAILFGVNYIKTENASFDEKFRLKSKDSEKIASLLFTNEKIRDLLLKMSDISYITIKNSNSFMSRISEDIGQICLSKSYFITDEKELIDIFNLLEQMLLFLADNGMISEQRADIKM